MGYGFLLVEEDGMKCCFIITSVVGLGRPLLTKVQRQGACIMLAEKWVSANDLVSDQRFGGDALAT